MINTIMSFSQHAGFGMPASRRVRVASLRALPMTRLSCRPLARVRLRRQDRRVEATRLDTDVAVPTGAFPGTSAWSPPI